MDDPKAIHTTELKRLGVFMGLLGALFGATYLVDWEGLQAAAAESDGVEVPDLRPWVPGEPIPLARLFDQGQKVIETEPGRLTVADDEEIAASGGGDPVGAVEIPVEIPVDVPVHAPPMLASVLSIVM